MEKLVDILVEDKPELNFNEKIRYFITNLVDFKYQYCEGIPKIRIMKMVLLEIAELKKVNKFFI